MQRECDATNAIVCANLPTLPVRREATAAAFSAKLNSLLPGQLF
jgi:hypothetical protein